MDWFFFILLNAALFIRPADLLQTSNLPVYNVLMIACLAVSATRLLALLNSLADSPVTVCVLGVLVACVLSHLFHGKVSRAVVDSFSLVKIIIYYLLLVALVDSPARLRSFLRWLVVFTLVLTALALAHYLGYIVVPSLEAIQQKEVNPETGELEVFPRLCSTGVFADPNDLSMIIVLALIACLFFIDGARGCFTRLCWLPPVAVFLYALKLTYSRGGLINLGVSFMVVAWNRLGWQKTLLISVLALPAMLALFGGRMTRADMGDAQGTSQQRIQLWAEGVQLLRENPVFGIGMNEYSDRVGLVAHNSFVHSYTELGFFGGTMFVGAFYAALAGAWRLGNGKVTFYDPTLKRLRPYVLAIICSYCAGMFSLSRSYTITTYTFVGIAAAYLQTAETRTSAPGLRFDSQFIQRLFLVGAGVLLFIYIFIRSMVRWH